MKTTDKITKWFEKLGEKFDALWYKITRPKWVVEKEKKHLAEVEAIDVNALSKPVNDVETSGPKKMKNFAPWEKWKSMGVGVIGILFIFLVWWLYSYITKSNGETSLLSSPSEVWIAFYNLASSGVLWQHMGYSFGRVLAGYGIAVVTSIPIAFLMAWYKPVRAFLDPFIQFLRCIPPIAYVPLIVYAMGVGEGPKYFIIWLAVFLTMTVTIYQGVRNVDLTLVKAAYTFGARDRNLFTGVIVPSAFPFILTAMRLGVGAAMTTLVAAELTGATYGLGALINTQASFLRFDIAIACIIILGVFGILLDKILLYFEKRLTRWK